MIEPYPAGRISVQMLSSREAALLVNGVRVGVARMNHFKLWPAQTGIGVRYYSNPLACFIDAVMMRNATAADVAYACPPWPPWANHGGPRRDGYMTQWMRERRAKEAIKP